MATAAVLQAHDVPTTLNYYAPIGDEAPYQYVQDPPADKPSNNLGADPHPVTVNDARGRESDFNLDKNGFQFVKNESELKEFDNDEKIEKVYYKEVEELLKKEAGAKRVFIFDHTIRRKPGSQATPGQLLRGPVERVHIDQTFDASVARVHRHLGDEADELLKGRVRIINVWRPINHPVAHKPLAVSDWRYLDTDHDLVPVRFIYPDRVGGTFSVKYNPEHKWYYLSNQTPEEVTLIKCYDSKVDRARLTPHSAFLDESSPKEAPHRESIEIRALVFSDD
ncbi:asaB hydroxylase/desaturase family protein [Abortiporus biennis]